MLDVFDSFYVGWTGVCGCDADEFDLDVFDCLVALLIVNSEFKSNFLANIVLSAREVYFSYIMSTFLNLSEIFVFIYIIYLIQSHALNDL